MITAWDITDPADPEFLWTFPESGSLDTPHGCMARMYDGQLWMIWAHTEGAPTGGSVGVALANDPTVVPEYVADLLPAGDVDSFGFLRGVELTTDGVLYLTDSGGGGGFGGSGQVVKATFPAGLAPTGASGAVDSDQVFVDLTDAEVLLDGLDNPFEGFLWDPPFLP